MAVAKNEDVARRFCLVCHEAVRLGLAVNKTEFCNSVNLRVQNFNLIEKGVRTVCVGRVCDLVNVYNVSLVWLFRGEGDMFVKEVCDGEGGV